MGTQKRFLGEVFSLGSIPNEIVDVSRHSRAVLLHFVNCGRGR